jgi:hypothetical protein
MKRILLLVTLAAMLAAAMALSAVGASAEPQCTVTKEAKGTYTEVCVETFISFGQETSFTSQPCEDVNGRTGTQQGTLIKEFQFTTTTTTTTVFKGKPEKGKIISGPTPVSVEDRDLKSETFTPTGECVVPVG